MFQNEYHTLIPWQIKCHMNDNNPPCNRCKVRGLACSVNKSLQMLLENDASYVVSMASGTTFGFNI